ncbi:MAG TPA: hypothetical protein PLU30_21460 [Verrucomicrobiae bacterium]|nr:hypothetical protein [Verrucomicrobiae bacterium]
MRTLVPILALTAAWPAAWAQQPAAPAPEPQARPTPARESKPKPPDRDTLPFDDPLARQKLDHDLWITKGVQGGFKTEELWILQPPAAIAAPTATETAQPKDRNAPGSWSAMSGSMNQNRPEELTAEERVRLFQEWERFVFGEPKKSTDRSGGITDPWRKSETRDDNPRVSSEPPKADFKISPLNPTLGSAQPQDSAVGSLAPNTPPPPRTETTDIDAKFSPFGAPVVPGLRPEGWSPDAYRNSSLPLSGIVPQTPLGLPGGLPATDPRTMSTPNTLPFSPFSPQAPGMNFGLPQNNPQMPGAPQGPTPTPRAHSTDSFMPRQW